MTSPSPLSPPETLDSTVTSADGTTIAYSAWGAGEPIVIIDGATAYRATTPENAATAELLADEFLVINYDRRGRGGSGDTPPYAVEREFEDLAAILEHVGGGRAATVFGWSSGGNLALNAAQAGVPIARLAVFEANAVVDDDRPPLPADYVQRAEDAVAAGRPGDAVALFLSAAVGLPDEMIAELRQDPKEWPPLEAIGPTIAYDGRQVGDAMSGRPLRSDLWNRVDVPVLVMHGRDTWPFLAAAARAIAEHLPTATLKPVPGENHSTSPEVLAAALRQLATEGA
ncbi:alpha/beta hydrolase fold protein [Beutenbergia cavernae DSM 12333]|uniref:Alpha/beta hydrolase fold protein n=1 Tax=Beutenbergia cavernae (strain ATCC BAA-8 / DSM 12333 / CCUG 43141 / JCM 11478 / NBRC 16432 / NCIMB 13614 / HKI 0122) TaxID=471853 RepID=C5C476_BEUC1|nr:alpha/beta hydrolase [Beutenbergia cavernae]ACQ79989.1 alpha/beta hydrolase fold protein [Beutenbergia cavernae DSM 12333]